MANRPQTTTNPAKALGQKISDLNRRVRALELRPSGGSSAPAPSWIATSHHHSSGVDPGNLIPDLTDDDFTYWLDLSDVIHPPTADEGATSGWTFVDHLGSGRPTMMVPPEPGAYAGGAQALLHYSAPPDTFYVLRGGPVLIGHSDRVGHEGYYSEFWFGQARTMTSTRYVESFNSALFAPLMLDGTTNNEVGIGWKVTISSSHAPAVIYNMGETMVWAHKVG